MPAPPSSLIDPAIGHLVELAGDATEEQLGLLGVLAQVADPRHRRAAGVSRPTAAPVCPRRDHVIDRIARHERASTPSDTRSVNRPPAVTTPLSAISRDHADYQSEHHGATHP
jgi:hypothetical protein